MQRLSGVDAKESVAAKQGPALCWICGSADSRPFRASTIKDKIDSTSVRISDSAYGQTAALSECKNCSFVFANPIPHPSVVDLYRGMDDNEYHDSSEARRFQMRRLLDEVTAVHPQAKTLLDVGAGTGLLVSEAQKRGLQAEGVEPSRWGVDTAARVNGVKLLCGTLQENANQLGEYDIVMLIDVVEHTTDPMGMIREAVLRLSPGGVVVIVTPDISSMTARTMKRWWWHHRIAHVCFFNQKSIRRVLEQLGVQVVSDRYAGWRLPVSYLCDRLKVYLPVPVISGVLKRMANSRRVAQYSVNINLRDSRTFIGKRTTA
jgi:2-polyprenyl-3-methyl-5-hydroxy-6-metoxy-1,4-benzoquinol methylase